MRFGKTLRNSKYPPWKDQYIDYDKLKKLLREGGSAQGSAGDDDDDLWTEEDESRFVEELVNVQLEKVHNFHSDTYRKVRERTARCESRLDELIATASGEESNNGGSQKKLGPSDEEKERVLAEVLKELDGITKETSELEKYSRINYTGFLKAAKKHDRRRGRGYRVRPLLQVRLAALPFNQEDYSPLLFRLSAMYSFIRQNLGRDKSEDVSQSDSHVAEGFTCFKFWVHPENILEVKTVILRRLPVLVYNPQTSKVAEGSQPDPTITSIYFDNPKFSLYTDKVTHAPGASSLRLRWYGQLAEKPEILIEKKSMKEGDSSEEERFPIKEKYIQSFIRGEYRMEKSLHKIQERAGEDPARAGEFQKNVDDIQAFIKESQLQPVLRANYSRTAFQIPGDDRIRMSLDTDLALIREDAIDLDRPCRDPDDWHRLEIDENQMEHPFPGIRRGEINRFPFAVLEIKLKGRKRYEWVSELMGSHLVREAPRFSKFVHGVATLFEDYVNSFPFWLSLVETDIRRDPQQAYREEQEKKAKAAEDEFAVGSLFAAKSSPAFRPAISPSPHGSPSVHPPALDRTAGRAMAEMARRASVAAAEADQKAGAAQQGDWDADGRQGSGEQPGASTSAGLKALFPSFSTSRYARAHRPKEVRLPPGVQKPTTWIKDQGPVKVEAKVWLANQRTFIKWMHVSVLLASLSLALYNAAGQANGVARHLAVVYTVIAALTALWAWVMFMRRSQLIEQRSGKDFDNPAGPIFVCVALIVALCLNFGFKYHAATQKHHAGPTGNSSTVYTDVSEL